MVLFLFYNNKINVACTLVFCAPMLKGILVLTLRFSVDAQLHSLMTQPSLTLPYQTRSTVYVTSDSDIERETLNRRVIESYLCPIVVYVQTLTGFVIEIRNIKT